jgi:hypothetical protein
MRKSEPKGEKSHEELQKALPAIYNFVNIDEPAVNFKKKKAASKNRYSLANMDT